MGARFNDDNDRDGVLDISPDGETGSDDRSAPKSRKKKKAEKQKSRQLRKAANDTKELQDI